MCLSLALVLYLYTNTKNAYTTQTLNIYALRGIRTHDPGVHASENSPYLRPLGYRDLFTQFNIFQR
jgi:hypothetical protein